MCLVSQVYYLPCIRMGSPADKELFELVPLLNNYYAATSWPDNQLLCELLIYLEVPSVIGKSLILLDAAKT